MNRGYFLFFVFFVSTIAVYFLLYPLRSAKKSILCILGGSFLFGIIGGYQRWGSWLEWGEYIQEIQKKERVKAYLANLPSKEELIKRMQAALRLHPDSARGWYLLGKLLMSLQDWQKAKEAFAKAYQLDPNDIDIKVQYAKSIAKIDHAQFDAKAKDLLLTVLQQNPAQLEAHALLAWDAYQHKDCSEAIYHWKAISLLLPPEAEEARSLQIAIAKCMSSEHKKS